MILLDVNVLVYAYDSAAPKHTEAKEYLTKIFNGDEKIGIPWMVINGFLRTVTNPKAYKVIFDPQLAMEAVLEWINLPMIEVTKTGDNFKNIYRDLVKTKKFIGNDIPDLFLAAMALENNATLVSYDRDFARYESEGLKWFSPIINFKGLKKSKK